ncbi:NADPH-dependent ferric siderophore reductase [Amycolatopsis coloradensis]|uniref:NADPH-dependent ferric siderophore reductase n=1 Tax=Amycolatopsis coloradensis TaxID=76021 RepID=A0A1R0KQC3_9PSEU|nr:siderophore-interacting protein [Amycolatopsis coloradensis]OLZ49343.1 NADPH-dependent ferric siderophore reductase [Amycolatopsis coloradensis]
MSYIEAKVTGVRRLTPHMSRVTFAGASLEDQAPDQYLKVFFPQPGQPEPVLPAPLGGDEVYSWYKTYLAMPDDVRPPMRTYTVRALRPSAQEVDIDFVLHGDEGPASAWASRASEGDRVAFLGPHGLYDVPSDTNWQLLVGDETAIPAIGAIVEALPAGTRAVVYVEIGDREDRQVFETPGTVELHWVVRGSRDVGSAVLEAVRKAELPGGTPYAWISGEANMVKLVRRHLVRERGVDKRAICFTGYWRQGVSEEAAGREAMRQRESGEVPLDED